MAWLWGKHAVLAALNNPDRQIEELYCTISYPEARPYPVYTVSTEHCQRLLPSGAVHQGFVAKVKPLSSMALEKVVKGPLLFLDQITDPYNVGALWRSAAAFGVQGVIMTKHHSPPLDGILAKAASGALEHVPSILVSNLTRALEDLKKRGFYCYGLCETGISFVPPVSKESAVVILGAEGHGLRQLTRKTCDFLIRIPTCKPFSTLNVSAAGAVALYAFFVQKT